MIFLEKFLVFCVHPKGFNQCNLISLVKEGCFWYIFVEYQFSMNVHHLAVGFDLNPTPANHPFILTVIFNIALYNTIHSTVKSVMNTNFLLLLFFSFVVHSLVCTLLYFFSLSYTFYSLHPLYKYREKTYYRICICIYIFEIV